MPLKIEIELEYAGGTAINEDGDTYAIGIEDAIVFAAAEKLLRQVINDNHYRSLKERADAIKDEEIRTRLAPMIEEAVAHSLQPTDGFGFPKGEPVTLAQYIVKVGSEYFTKEVGDYNRRETVIKKFIREEVERQFHGELQKALIEAKAEVLAAVKEQGAELMAQTIAKMAGIS